MSGMLSITLSDMITEPLIGQLTGPARPRLAEGLGRKEAMVRRADHERNLARSPWVGRTPPAKVLPSGVALFLDFWVKRLAEVA